MIWKGILPRLVLSPSAMVGFAVCSLVKDCIEPDIDYTHH